MILSVQQVKYEFLAYIKEFDPSFGNWYVGISDNPKRELFETHAVRGEGDPWLYKQLLTFRAARTVQARPRSRGADARRRPGRAST